MSASGPSGPLVHLIDTVKFDNLKDSEKRVYILF